MHVHMMGERIRAAHAGTSEACLPKYTRACTHTRGTQTRAHTHMRAHKHTHRHAHIYAHARAGHRHTRTWAHVGLGLAAGHLEHVHLVVLCHSRQELAIAAEQHGRAVGAGDCQRLLHNACTGERGGIGRWDAGGSGRPMWCWAAGHQGVEVIDVVSGGGAPGS